MDSRAQIAARCSTSKQYESDHHMQFIRGDWSRQTTHWFQRCYQAGPVLCLQLHPRLITAF